MYYPDADQKGALNFRGIMDVEHEKRNYLKYDYDVVIKGVFIIKGGLNRHYVHLRV